MAALAPFALLPLGPSAALWTALQLLLAIASVGVLAGSGLLDIRSRTAGVALLAAAGSMPTHEVLLHGQMSFAIMFGFALFFAGLHGGRAAMVAAGIALIAIKPQLAIVPAIYLLASGQARPLAWATAGWIAALAAYALAFGPGAMHSWISLLAEAWHWDDENGVWIHAMFGWNALVRAMVGPDWDGLRLALSASLSLLTVAVVVARVRRKEPLSTWRLAVLIAMASALVSPHLFAQDLVVPMLAVVLAVAGSGAEGRSAWLVYALAGWLATFFHFGALLPPPDEPGVNLVTLWMACGLLLAAVGTPFVGVERLPQRVAEAPRRPGLPVAARLAIGSVTVGTLLLTLSGFAELRYAEAITYSYTARNGPTYRYPITNLGFDG